MKLLITVDTEADNQWKRGERITLSSIKCLPRFQGLCERYGYKVTYFVTHEVATDPESVAMLKDFQDHGWAEVGAHLHPWTTPPFQKGRCPEEHPRFPSELSDDELRAKLTTLTDVIRNAFGKAPTSYRAGRWGFDKRHIPLLQELGYAVDSSVTPKISWKRTPGVPDGPGGPDFTRAPHAPYLLDPEDVCKEGVSRLLEVPMTVLFTRAFASQDSFAGRVFAGMSESWFKRAINALFFRQSWMRFFPTSTERDFERMCRAASKAKLPTVQFMIHSSELLPGGSPYAKTEESVERIYTLLEQMLTQARRFGFKPSTLTEFARAAGSDPWIDP